MEKVKLAICINDAVYQERFVKCLMNHYKDKYELHVFQEIAELEHTDCRQYSGFILGGCSLDELGWLPERQEKALFLDEQNKYLEVYKIVEELELLLGRQQKTNQNGAGCRRKVVGIYSFTLPHMQLPFAATLAEIIGEKGKTILVDFQANSGLRMLQKMEELQLGMEDLMTVATTQNYTKGRILSTIGHRQAWDYVYPVTNSNYFKEATGEIIKGMLDLLAKELEYSIVIMNLQDQAEGLVEMLALCDTCFVLYPKGDAGIWREQHFTDEIKERGKEDVFHRIRRIEIPSVLGTDGGWEKISDQWKWGTLGDGLRKIVWEDI